LIGLADLTAAAETTLKGEKVSTARASPMGCQVQYEK
jgi:hypothetical protein